MHAACIAFAYRLHVPCRLLHCGITQPTLAKSLCSKVKADPDLVQRQKQIVRVSRNMVFGMENCALLEPISSVAFMCARRAS
jgi:hypothetical protein